MEKLDINHSTILKIRSLCPEDKLFFRINKNTNSLITVTRKKDGTGKKISLHYIFLKAPEDVIQSLATFIRRPNKINRSVIRKYIAENSEKIDRVSAQKKSTPIIFQGICYNLQGMLDKINKFYFDGVLSNLRITWAPQKTHTRKRVHSLNFGSFSYSEQLIRVHPVLDNYFVPKYFIEYIIYHEMLHAIIKPSVSPTGYMCYHHDEFKKREMEFKHYHKAEKWQKKNLKYLLKMVKTPRPLREMTFT